MANNPPSRPLFSLGGFPIGIGWLLALVALVMILVAWRMGDSSPTLLILLLLALSRLIP